MSDRESPTASPGPDASAKNAGEGRRSKTAAAARIFGVAGPVLALLGIGVVQLGAAPMVGFAMFQVAILSGLVALAAGGVGILTTRRVPGRGLAWAGIGLGLLMVVVVLFSAAPGVGVPPINDITTNLADPPGFAPADPDHRNHGRDMSYPPEFAPQVRAAYPDLAPISIAAPPDAAYQHALKEARALGWEITREDPESRTFEAEDTTALFRFVDDVSVRVRPAPEGGSTIDVRSKSRDGRGDLGANANRIRAFATAVGSLPLRASPRL